MSERAIFVYVMKGFNNKIKEKYNTAVFNSSIHIRINH
ncbi:hypothetical protein ykris0001_14220 [Yersinia kristensenii ATCC 33638]|nr:hypothetical protein ykris0001_14220 [Yersinia kristensenii ATCC 33638]